MARGFVICATAVALFAEFSFAQYGSQSKKDAGPRALALLELAPNGTGHLIPIAIMYDGDFFDASAYKADPVPMALDSGTVYEAMRTGSSQGLFTVTLASQSGSNWIGTGRWQDSAALAAEAARRKKAKETAEKPPVPDEDDSGPPKLLRRSNSKPDAKQPETREPASPAGEPSKPGSAPSTAEKTSEPAASSPKAASSGTSPDESDPDRPRLERRDQASPTSNESMTASPKPAGAQTAPSPTASKSAANPSAANMAAPSALQEIPAISDAGGPDPRSYIFPLKPGEYDQFRKKMLAQATRAILAQFKQSQEPILRPAGRAASRTRTAKAAPAPDFDQVQLRFFDLSSSNQPLMVLEAMATVPGRDVPQHITLITRQDINGDLHNALVNITDARHLDVIAQMDLLDAVDADGDGRGELFFRETSDQGHAYSIYRVIGDQLYQLYESAPQ